MRKHAAWARKISIHVPRAGDDRNCFAAAMLLTTFQSTSPVRGTTHARLFVQQLLTISIHVPRAGDDGDFEVYAPCTPEFQSTSPVRGTTSFTPMKVPSALYFNPRPPCGGRPVLALHFAQAGQISIHVPRAGDDTSAGFLSVLDQRFQSTSPVRGTTHLQLISSFAIPISIHVPRAGDDQPITHSVHEMINFNPRPPCGGRRRDRIARARNYLHFNPRPPCGGRLILPERKSRFICISIHVPRAGDDLAVRVNHANEGHISIHVPRAGDDDLSFWSVE